MRKKPGNIGNTELTVAQHKVVKDLKEKIGKEMLVACDGAIDAVQACVDNHTISASLVGINKATLVGEALSRLVEEVMVASVAAMSEVRGDLGPEWLTNTLHRVCFALTEKSGLRHAIQLAIEKPKPEEDKDGPNIVQL